MLNHDLFDDERVKKNTDKSLFMDAFSIKSHEINTIEVEQSQLMHYVTVGAFSYNI